MVGYDGSDCQCAKNTAPSAPHGACSVTPGTTGCQWSCTCNPGWHSSGSGERAGVNTSCVQIIPIVSPYQLSSREAPNLTDPLSGTYGPFCDIPSTHPDQSTGCTTSPCLHGGTCSSFNLLGTETIECACLAGYTGERCENRPTQANTGQCSTTAGPACQNGGVCTELFGVVTCACSTGYGGTHCELYDDVNDCQTGNPCNSHGACENVRTGTGGSPRTHMDHL